MNVLGLDLSLTETGVCFPDGSTELLKPKMRGLERLAWIREEVWERTALPHSMASVDLAVIEGYSFNSKAAGEHLGELGGVVRLRLWEGGIPFLEVPPATLKKYATGRGNATKPDMRAERYKRSGTDERNDNANDAWWLWQAGLTWLMSQAAPWAVPDGWIAMPALNTKALEGLQVVGSLALPV